MGQPLDMYRKAQVTTCSRGDLLVALIDGAIRHTYAAQQAIERKDYAAKGYAVTRVITILAELAATLRPEGAEAVCGMLKAMYAHMTARLLHASHHMQVHPVQEVLRHLRALRTTWAEAVVLARQQGHRV